ncbi:MAG: phosphoribosylformylglycinamidine cyclo-ligase [Acidimicrobiales bacterium]|nr:phosphoribosylformylglycinamidine cyclo-ligase [Acidimicrobiales bacterium]
MTVGETYAGAGVDIDAGEKAVERIGPAVKSTHRSGVVGSIGGFGGLFDLAAAGYDDGLLVSSTDGVGTKAMVATAAGRFDTIGIDLVAMCVDDLVCQGAEPLFFLDYVSVGALDPDMVEALVAGVAEGCRQAGCALIGGEMAEHPGAMGPGEFDLVGFSVGAVERHRVLTGGAISPGDVLVALPSPNLRSNGYSLARRLVFDVAGKSIDDPAWEGADTTVADELLDPSVIYAPAVLSVLNSVSVGAVAHITGGGLPGNLNRVLGDSADAIVDPTTWEQPRVFTELQAIGNVAIDEMRRTFNLGVGMVLVVPEAEAATAISVLDDSGHRGRIIGEIAPGTGAVRFTDE